MNKSARFSIITATIGLATVCAGTWSAEAAPYTQTDLVSDVAGLASITDPALQNPWGLTSTSTSPFWIADQISSQTNLWAVTGGTNVSKVTAVNPPTGNIAIPPGSGPQQGPTGAVANTNTSAFAIGGGGNGGSAHFIFANENGSISAWDTGATAFT